MKLLFPTVIHELKVKSFKSIKKDLVNFVYEEKVKDPDGVIFSNKGGWQSQPTYNSRSGKYTRIGNLVYIAVTLDISSLNTSDGSAYTFLIT